MDQSVYLKLQDILVRASNKAINIEMGEIKLLAAVLVQATRDNDSDYFVSEEFLVMCKMLQLNPDRISSLCLKFMAIVDDMKNDNQQE